MAGRLKSGGPQLDGAGCLTGYSSDSAVSGRLQTQIRLCHRPIGRAACRGCTGQSAMHSAGWPCEGTGRELRKTCCIRCIFVHTGSKLNSRMNTNTMNNVTNESATTTMGGQEGVRQNVSSQVSRSGVVLVDEGEVPWVQCAGREWGCQQGTAQSGSLGRRVMGGRVKGDGGWAGEGRSREMRECGCVRYAPGSQVPRDARASREERGGEAGTEWGTSWWATVRAVSSREGHICGNGGRVVSVVSRGRLAVVRHFYCC